MRKVIHTGFSVCVRTLRNGLLAGLLISSLGCAHSVRTQGEYMKWLNDPSNGIVKTKHIGGFDIKVKFLPPSFLLNQDVSKNISGITPKEKDSLLNIYTHSLTFMMTLGPDEADSNTISIMYAGVKTYKDYVQRDLILNFDFKEFVHIEVGDKKYIPVLAIMENSYELGLKRNIIIAFVPDDKNDNTLFTADDIDFIYDDELFDLGLNHFLFKQKNLQNTPAFPELAAN